MENNEQPQPDEQSFACKYVLSNISRVTKKPDILAHVREYAEVAGAIYAHAALMFDDIESAVKYHAMFPKHILMHFPDLQLFGMFTVEKYNEAADDVRKAFPHVMKQCTEDQYLIASVVCDDYRAHQIVAVDMFRRFVVNVDSNHVDHVRKYAELCFGAHVTCNRGGWGEHQLSIETAIRANDAHAKLAAFISGLKDEGALNSIHIIKPEVVNGVEYVTFDVSDTLHTQGIKDIQACPFDVMAADAKFAPSAAKRKMKPTLPPSPHSITQPNYVYFIKSVDPQLPELHVKIGRSTNPYARLNQLKTGCPYRLELVATITCDAVRVEAELHKKHKKRRIPGGEWFRFSQDELNQAVDDAWIHVLGVGEHS